jgi:hypothetical protein
MRWLWFAYLQYPLAGETLQKGWRSVDQVPASGSVFEMIVCVFNSQVAPG